MSELLAQIDNPGLLRPIATSKDILAAQEATTSLITDALKRGVDYGLIPGAGKKEVLLKAGAERLNNAFGVYPDYEVTEREIDHDREVKWVKSKKQYNNRTRDDKTFTTVQEEGLSLGLYRYVVRCTLKLRGSDTTIGTGIGTCSTLESKYIDRPRDCENTVLKMAEKRALVGATLNAYALSDRFTQDTEDIKQNQEAAGIVDAEFTEEVNYLTLTTPVNEREHKEALAYIGVCGWSKDQYKEITEAAKPVDVRRVLLSAKQKSVTDPGEVLSWFKPVDQPAPTDPPKDVTKPPKKTHKFEFVQEENAEFIAFCAEKGLEPVATMNARWAVGIRTFQGLMDSFGIAAPSEQVESPSAPAASEYDPFADQ